MTNEYGRPEWAEWLPELTGSTNLRAARMRRVAVLLAIVTLLTAASAGAVSWLKNDGPPHPEDWDPRVQELVDFVEAERGLAFTEPVYVDLLGDADFTAELRADGPVRPDTGDEPTARSAYYSYAAERIRVPGTELTPAVRAHVVRALVQALQDQRFDVGRRLGRLAADPEASTALLALVAADAARVQTTWREEAGEQVEDAPPAAPPAAPGPLPAPYVLAEAALDLAAQIGGDKAVDGLFRRPPSTEEHLLDPWTLLADRAVPILSSTPDLSSGEVELHHGTFGAVSWLMLLAERISPSQALTAADGWGGDAYVAFTREGASCIRATYRGDTGRDVRQMRTALAEWVAASPPGSAHVRRAGTQLSFESCATGDARTTSGPQDAVALSVDRTALSATLVHRGWTPARARCGADILVRALTREQLEGRLDDPRTQALTVSCKD